MGMASEGESEMVNINLNRFHKCIDTWISSEREGYKLYLNEEMSSGPSDEYILVQYDWQNENWEIIAMGYVDISPEVPTIADVNGVLKGKDLTPLTDDQWCTVAEAYSELTRLVLRDQIFEGVPQLYKNVVYHEIDDFQAAMEQYIDQYHDKIEKYEAEQEEEDKERTFYDEYADFGRLGDDQYHYIGEVLEEALDWENADTVPYAKHCQLAAILEFETYEDWEVRAIEHLHNGVLVNKPALAKTKALLENELSQKEIAEKLGKSQSTVSRQVSQISQWEQRAEWTSNQ